MHFRKKVLFNGNVRPHESKASTSYSFFKTASIGNNQSPFN